MSEATPPYGSGPGAQSEQSAQSGPPPKRVRVHHLRAMKERGERFAMLTAYEQYAAEIFDEAGIPVLLVGDSAANNVLGYETTLPVTVEELLPLVRAVSRSARRALVVADLPFGDREPHIQEAEIEGFGEVIICARFERLMEIFRVAARRDEETAVA